MKTSLSTTLFSFSSKICLSKLSLYISLTLTTKFSFNSYSFITSKITLQSAPLGSASYTNVSGVLPSTQTVYDRSNITHLCSFPISTSKNYRIKIEITDEVNGKQATVTKYKTLTR